MHKIAILDSDLFASQMYEIKLRQHNYRVETAFDGLTGLRLINQFKPDLLLIDFHLPSLNGIETLEKLFRSTFHKPKIIMTSNIDHEIVQNQSTHLPVDHYFTKVEHTPTEVLQIIRNVMRVPAT